MNNKLRYVTSFTLPEKKIDTERWGAVGSHLLPFQVRAIQPVSNHAQFYMSGITHSKIESLNEMNSSDYYRVDINSPGFGLNKSNLFFHPNPVLTDYGKGKRYLYEGSPATIDEGKLDKNLLKEKTWLAAVCFIGIDVDFKDTSEEELKKRIQKLPLQPTTIVHSGNGYHLYFSVKHIYLVKKKKLDFSSDLMTIYCYEHKVREISQNISNLLGGDPVANKNVTGTLRVPNTFNYKIINGKENIKYCKYLKGDLVHDYHNPTYELQQLIDTFAPELNILQTQTSIDYTYRIKDRAKPNMDRVIRAGGNFWNHFNIQKPNKGLSKYFQYIYGRRNYPTYMEYREVGTNRSAGQKRSEIKKHRDTMLKLGVIELVEKGNYKKRTASIYRLTDLFFEACKVKRKVTNKGKVQVVLAGKIPEGQYRPLIKEWWGTLKAAGYEKLQIRSIMENKIQQRDVIKGDEGGLLDWCEEHFY